MKVIAYNNEEGLVSIIYPYVDQKNVTEENPFEKLEEEIIDKAVKNLTCEYLILDSEELPSKDIDRNAWVIQSDKIVVCEDRKMQIIRDLRNQALAELDKQQAAAQFNPNANMQKIINLKEKLRDITEIEGDKINYLKKLLKVVY